MASPQTGAGSEDLRAHAYWKANIRLVTGCLIVWAFASFGCAILFRPLLSGIPVGGTDLGFWFAQQGSIIVFIILILIYAILLNRLDNEYAGKTSQEDVTPTTGKAEE